LTTWDILDLSAGVDESSTPASYGSTCIDAMSLTPDLARQLGMMTTK
jgi:hypothetical protein